MKKSSANGKLYSFFPKVRQSTTSGDFYDQKLPKVLKVQSSVQQMNLQLIGCENDDIERLKKENTTLKEELNNAKLQIDQLTKDNKKYHSDLVSLKKLYNTTCQSYVKKEMQLKILEKKQMPHAEIDRPLYDSYNNTLGESTVQQLRVIGGNRNRDSTFVLTCMKSICENKNLKDFTACGRTKNGHMSPDKKKMMEDIFFERLINLQLDEMELNERHLRLNCLINSAINNISRKKVSRLVCKKSMSKKICSYLK